MTLVGEPVPVTLTRRPPSIAGHRPELLPLQDGEQWRFTFEVAACVGCHSCEVACAEQNSTPVDGAWRRVGEMEGGDYPDTRRFSLSIACNHCVEPTCLSGCPTNAYEKLANGIVVHHEDECIGCQYCIWNCPYEVPVFNPVRKVVSKCDLCRPRIEAGQEPACVGACPTRAIGIEAVDVAAWRVELGSERSPADAPGLPPASITMSTTRIVLPDDLPAGMAPANEHAPRPEHPHWPLVVLTLLTQLSLGMAATTVALDVGGAAGARSNLGGAAVAVFVAGALALGASLLHLGRPSRAFKALRNLRTSWLSREVAAFGAFSTLSLAYAASWPVDWLPGRTLGAAAVVAGVVGVGASARLYLVPARPVWNTWRTPASFFGTVVATGPLAALLCLDRSAMPGSWVGALVAIAGAGTVAQVAVSSSGRRSARADPDPQHQGTAELLDGRFRDLRHARTGGTMVALALLAATASVPLGGPAAGGRLAGALVVVALAELAGRYLFYVTVVPYHTAASFFGGR